MRIQGRSCVVLGGGGFVGTNLCRRLAAAGNRVRAFGRRCMFPDALTGVEWQQGDFGDAVALANAIENFDIVFHFIHSTTPYSANLDMIEDARQNVLPSIALLDTSCRLGVKRIVFLSSGGTVYGRPQQIPTDETAPTEPITAYGISKLAIEKYFALYEYLHGMEYRVLRVANPFGPYQIPVKRQGVIAEFISRAVANEDIDVWGDGSVIRDFIYVDDVIDALEAAALDESKERIFNIGSGTGRSIREIIAMIENKINSKLNIRWKNSRPVDIPVSILSIDRARTEFGWTPRTSFELGVEKTIVWWENGMPKIKQLLHNPNWSSRTLPL